MNSTISLELYCLYWSPLAQKFEVVELFAGKAWVSRCMKQCGQSVASFDIDFGEPRPGKQNAMDLLSDAGFAPLWLSFTAYMLYDVFLQYSH